MSSIYFQTRPFHLIRNLNSAAISIKYKQVQSIMDEIVNECKQGSGSAQMLLIALGLSMDPAKVIR